MLNAIILSTTKIPCTLKIWFHIAAMSAVANRINRRLYCRYFCVDTIFKYMNIFITTVKNEKESPCRRVTKVDGQTE